MHKWKTIFEKVNKEPQPVISQRKAETFRNKIQEPWVPTLGIDKTFLERTQKNIKHKRKIDRLPQNLKLLLFER